MTRIGETLKAEWAHVDLEAARWFIPAENTKTKAAITIALSDFTVRQMKALKDETGETAWLFPARDGKSHVDEKSVTKQVADRQIRFKSRSKSLTRRKEDNSLVLGDSVNGEWIPHDMRRTSATLMQQLRIQPDIIDRCQNHYLGGSLVRRSYQQHDYAEEMREAWSKLGTRLDDLMQKCATRRAAEGKTKLRASLTPCPVEDIL